MKKPCNQWGKKHSYLSENIFHRSLALVSKAVPSYVGFRAMGVSAFSPCCLCCVRPRAAVFSLYWGGGGTCGSSHWLKEHWARKDRRMPTRKKKNPNHKQTPKLSYEVYKWKHEGKNWPSWEYAEERKGKPEGYRRILGLAPSYGSIVASLTLK